MFGEDTTIRRVVFSQFHKKPHAKCGYGDFRFTFSSYLCGHIMEIEAIDLEIEAIDTLYGLTSMGLSYSATIISAVLLMLYVPHGKTFRDFRMAKNCISLTCLILGVGNVVSTLMHDDDNDLISYFIIVIGSLQAVLFTITSLVMLGTVNHLRRFVVVNLVAIITVAALYGLVYFTFPSFRTVATSVVATLYTLQMAFYTWFYIRKARQSLRILEDSYDDDLPNIYQWTNTLFYSALVIGLFSLIAAIWPVPVVCNIFNFVVPAYYAYVCIVIVNYIPRSATILHYRTIKEASEAAPQPNAIESHPDGKPIPSGEDSEAASADGRVENPSDALIDRWIAERHYLDNDKTVDEILRLVHASRQQFSNYFMQHYNQQFRTWRREMRIREAQSILEAEPDISTSDLMARVGYNDRSNLHKHFKEIIGMTLQEFRAKASDCNDK